MDKKVGQKLPKWFDGECYTQGGKVANRFTGIEYELTAEELSMYDFVIGASNMYEMGMHHDTLVKDLRRGLNWFRVENPKAYYVLLD